MSFLEKQNELLLKLHDTNYEMFDGDKEEALDFISESLSAFPNYANIVVKEQVMLPIWKHRCEPNEYRENVQMLDKQRRNAHDCAIDSMNMLNRLGDNLGLEPMFDIDTEDRHAVADAVGKYICEVYNDGIGKTFDDAVYNKTSEYDSKKINERLNAAINGFNTSAESSENKIEHELS